jgi:hypothetical protein
MRRRLSAGGKPPRVQRSVAIQKKLKATALESLNVVVAAPLSGGFVF